MLLSSPGRLSAEITVTIDQDDPGIVIEGLQPYSAAAVFSIWLEQLSSGPHHQQTTLHFRLDDDDGDGVVRYDADRNLTFWNRWLVADLATGETGSAVHPWYAPSADPDHLFRVEGGGLVWENRELQAAWVRPGVGHWKAPAGTYPWLMDGGPFDGDGQQNDEVLLRPAAFTGVEAEDPSPPTAFRDGDVLLLQYALWGRFKIVALKGPSVSLDLDDDRRSAALTDGLLLVRYLLGSRGSSLTDDALGPACKRCDGDAVALHLDSVFPLLDLDGDGSVGPFTDGVLWMRYLFGVRGDALTRDAVGDSCTRCAGDDIAAYLRGW